MKRTSFILLCCMAGTMLQAQEESAKLSYKYEQKVKPEGLDNYQFSTYFYSGKKTYNMRGAAMSSSGRVADFRVNPAGSSFAVVEDRGEQGDVLVYHLWKSNKLQKRIELRSKPTVLCYSPDSRLLAVACADHTVLVYDTRDYQALQRFETDGEVSRMAVSSNNYFLVTAGGSRVDVWNLQGGERRVTLSAEDVRDVVFSSDNSRLAVLSAGGRLTTYNAQTFAPVATYEALGDALCCDFHQDGKYMAVATSDRRIAIVNLLNPRDRDYIDNEIGGTTGLRFLKDGKKESYLAYNTAQSIVYTYMNQLSPYYTRLLADELNERMNEWLKQRPDETLEEYHQRVNDETRAEQLRLFEREIATRMADHLVDRSEVTLGSYNDKSQLLSLDFSTMPSIYLTVPKGEIGDFADPGILEFRNAVYGVNEEDRFELIYADVYNPRTGKTYVFDNLSRQSLAYLENDENFVPLSIIQQSNMEELKLQEIKNGIITLARKSNSITDKTHISVQASAASDVDPTGRRIVNYKIKFSYTVDQRYSAQEDFGPGKYKTEESGAAMTMLSIMKEAFATDFAKYIVPGKQLRVRVTGMADAAAIRTAIAYDGTYGEFQDEPIYKDGGLTNVSVSPQEGITTNDQLAFLRAVGVKRYVEDHVPDLQQMMTDYSYDVEVAKRSGSQFRRISVEYTFVDAF